MRPTEDIKNMIKKMEDKTSRDLDKRVLDDVLKTLEQSQKTQISIWRLIMKSTFMKFAAAAVIIIAVLIGINPFGDSKTNVVWADVAKNFESVPFFHLTIYFGSDLSDQSKKIEIWKSEDLRVRVHNDDTVIFADYSSNEEGKFTIFNRLTKEPQDSNGMGPLFPTVLWKEGRFSLDTLTRSFPPGVKGITPVETSETAVSRETVLFEARYETTPQRIRIWAFRNSKLPIRLNYSDSTNNESNDFLFDYSEQKDPSFFDPVAFEKQ